LPAGFFLPVNHGVPLQRAAAPASQTSASWRMLAAGEGPDDGAMEIRIILDRVEPPAGRLRIVPGPGRAHRSGAQQEIRFSGWLGLLRALYEVTGTPGGPSAPEP